jgi:CDP-glucose 4,6-dehydratase
VVRWCAAVEVLVMVTADFWAGKRVLLTGHTGFKGAWMALWLASLGARVHGFALPPSTRPALWQVVAGHERIDSVLADVRDRHALAASVSACEPEVVFHLAAQSLVRESYEDPVGTYATNVMGTVHLLDALRAQRTLRAVVVVTSDKCYQNHEHGRAYREVDPLGGRDPYSSSKACAELVSAACRASFFDAPGAAAIATARAGNVIGGGDWAHGRIVPDVVRSLGSGEGLSLRNPSAVRPWQHVLEPLAGYLCLAEALCRDGKRHAGAWNFGPGDRDVVTVQELAATLLRLWGADLQPRIDTGEHPHEARLLHLDSSKARVLLGWQPRLDLQAALEWTVEWYQGQQRGVDMRELCLVQIARYARLVAC